MESCILSKTDDRFLDDGTTVLTALITALSDPTELVRASSVQCIHVYVQRTHMSAAAVSAVISAFTKRFRCESAEDVRRRIMRAAADMSATCTDDCADDMTALCISGMRDPLAAVVIDAAIALEKLADGYSKSITAVPPLTAALRHHHADVRLHVVNALAAISLRTDWTDFAAIADAQIANEKSAKVLSAIATAACRIIAAQTKTDEPALLSALLILDCALLWPFNSLREHIATAVAATRASCDIRERVDANAADIIRCADALSKDWTNTRRRHGIAILNSLTEYAPSAVRRNTEPLIPLLRRVIRHDNTDDRSICDDTTNKLIAHMDAAIIITHLHTALMDTINLRTLHLMIRARRATADVIAAVLTRVYKLIDDNIDGGVCTELRLLFAAVISVSGCDARLLVHCLSALDAVSDDGAVDDLYAAMTTAYGADVLHLIAEHIDDSAAATSNQTAFSVRRSLCVLRRCAPVLPQYQRAVVPLLVALMNDGRDTGTRSRAVSIISALADDTAAATLMHNDAIRQVTTALARNCTWRVGNAAAALRRQSILTLCRIVNAAAADIFTDTEFREELLSVALTAVDDDETPIRRAAVALLARMTEFPLRDVTRLVSVLLARFDDGDDGVRIESFAIIRKLIRADDDDVAIQRTLIERAVKTHCHDTNTHVAAAATAIVSDLSKR